MLNLFKHQQNFIDKKSNRALLCWGTGTGKTIGSIAWCKSFDDIEKLLVICPKALKKNWQRNLTEHMSETQKWLVLTKEEFKRDIKTLSKADAVIVDEAHTFASMKSQMFKSLAKYFSVHQTKYRLLLTATPYTSSPWSIYALAILLGKMWSYRQFDEKFFVNRYISRRRGSDNEFDKGYAKARTMTVRVPKEGIERDVAQLVLLIGDVVAMEDCVDVPEQLHSIEYFELTPEQIKAKKAVTAIMPIAKFTKYSLIESGVLTGDEYNAAQLFPSYKIARALDVIAETKKVALVCRYNLQIAELYRQISETGKKVFIINGHAKDRDSVVQEVEASDECVVLIQADCAEGYQIPSVSVCLFMSMSYSLVKYTQILGRFLRIDKLEVGRNVFIYLLTDGESIDQAIYDCIMNKRTFSLAIYAARLSGDTEIQYVEEEDEDEKIAL